MRRTHKETDSIRLFLDGIIYSPETIKYLVKKDGILRVHKNSAPKPKSADDLTDDKIKEFLEQKIHDFLEFCRSEISIISSEDMDIILQQ